MVTEIFTGESESVGVNEKDYFDIFKEKSDKDKQESNEQPDTTDMSELESEESAAQRKINKDNDWLKKCLKKMKNQIKY